MNSNGFLDGVDAFYCGYPVALCELFMAFDKSVIFTDLSTLLQAASNKRKQTHNRLCERSSGIWKRDFRTMGETTSELAQGSSLSKTLSDLNNEHSLTFR